MKGVELRAYSASKGLDFEVERSCNLRFNIGVNSDYRG